MTNEEEVLDKSLLKQSLSGKPSSLEDKVKKLVREQLKDRNLDDVEHFSTRYERAKEEYFRSYTPWSDKNSYPDDYTADKIAHRMLAYGYKIIFDKS